mmetsp:Transcript_8409/g.22136  ORF Transcript_8409/g.22136 Transcript_8409/m.22136 type:complete len:268 (-) Transcript_8409:163-966(-)|eukprot:CAMPEP_0185829110 /NCGR_PEP_ID=MMETSP1353-20130828/49_1 /TAXON_ID=1077150 /ORGANISM="Erythrolobus australicus, Strain CCMP3124" /LENGTH=267 /DNA_ID=CAMNT_0028526859 /DNA_START=57 /DNA_END=860 /DNA_ORIENTATION=+
MDYRADSRGAENAAAGGIDWQAALKLSALSDHVRTHLLSVYSMLAALLACAAAGCLLNMYFHLPHLLLFGGSVAMLLYYLWNMASMTEALRARVMLGFAAFSGASLAPLVEMTAAVASEWTVLAALSCTALIFGCFSLSALLARRRSYLFLGAWLSSAMTCLFWLGLVGMFFPNRVHHALQLYGGLLMYSGFVIYDTQLIVEKADVAFRNGLKPSVVDDAMKLFTDFIAILRRVLIILARSQQRRSDDSRGNASSKRRSSSHRSAYD